MLPPFPLFPHTLHTLHGYGCNLTVGTDCISSPKKRDYFVNIELKTQELMTLIAKEVQLDTGGDQSL